MYFFNERQKRIMDLISKFACISVKQIEEITAFTDVINIMRPVIKMQRRNGIIFEQNIFRLLCLNEIDFNKLIAVRAYISICKKLKIPLSQIDKCALDECKAPYIISFIYGTNIYDIAVINKGDELLKAKLIERSESESVILVVCDAVQIDTIKKYLDKITDKRFIIYQNNTPIENM